MMTPSLKQIRYFIAAAELGQISYAAIELNISQSAVTTAIQHLENILAVKLFERSAGGVTLTAEGARFLQHARSIMAAVNEAMRTPLSGEVPQSGRVKVGVTYTVAGYFLPPHHARFARIYPAITLDLVELPREAIEEQLAAGGIDIAVMLVSNLLDHARLAHTTLCQSQRRLWLPTEHQLLFNSAITMADVASEPYVMLTVDEAKHSAAKYWEPLSLSPKIIFNTSSVEAVRTMVASGMGVTILSDMVFRPWSLDGQRIETRNLDAEIPSMDVGLAWLRERPPAQAVKTFMDFMMRAFGNPEQLEPLATK